MVDKKKNRNFPRESLEESLAVAQKIMDEMGGKPFNRLLLADALGTTPSSSNFKYLLSSSFQYGLTEGTEKAKYIELSEIGIAVSQNSDPQRRMSFLRAAARKPDVFNKFYSDFNEKKLPSPEMLGKILTTEYQVSTEHSDECAKLLVENGRFTGIIRDISGSSHIMIDNIIEEDQNTNSSEDEKQTENLSDNVDSKTENSTEFSTNNDQKHRPIFIGHGKNIKPLEKLQKFLSTFQIPYKVTIDEANLGRPIPQKVREIMYQCGSAILIFTCDERFFDENGTEIWRPSENVVHELGAASLLYEDRIVIFKEKGLHFPTNYQSIGYIEFDTDSIESKVADLLKELIGFGLIKVTPT